MFSSEDCGELRYVSDVARALNGKSPEVTSETAALPSRHEVENPSRVLAGRQSTLICLYYVVQCPYDSHLVASTIYVLSTVLN